MKNIVPVGSLAKLPCGDGEICLMGVRKNNIVEFPVLALVLVTKQSTNMTATESVLEEKLRDKFMGSQCFAGDTGESGINICIAIPVKLHNPFGCIIQIEAYANIQDPQGFLRMVRSKVMSALQESNNATLAMATKPGHFVH